MQQTGPRFSPPRGFLASQTSSARSCTRSRSSFQSAARILASQTRLFRKAPPLPPTTFQSAARILGFPNYEGGPEVPVHFIVSVRRADLQASQTRGWRAWRWDDDVSVRRADSRLPKRPRAGGGLMTLQFQSAARILGFPNGASDGARRACAMFQSAARILAFPNSYSRSATTTTRTGFSPPRGFWASQT